MEDIGSHKRYTVLYGRCGGACEGNYMALCDGRALRDARFVHRVCVWSPRAGGFLVPGLRPSSLGCGLLPLSVRGQGYDGDV